MTTTDNASTAAHQFDWNEAHTRLNRVLDRLEAAANPPPARVQEVLRERATRYAVARRSAAEESFAEVIGFSIGDDRFAIDLGQGTAVAALTNLTSLPGIPAFYLGLISHRGHIFPIVDPRPLLGVKREAGAKPRYAVLVGGEHGAIGLAAEEIQGITRYRTRDIAVIAEETSRFRAVRGMGPQDTMIIDSGRLLQDARLLVDDQPIIAVN
jgi:chemotaxis signal transduction protein